MARTTCLLPLALMLVGLAGCESRPASSQPATKPAEGLVVAVIPKATNHEYWKSIHAGAVKAADELGVRIIWKGPAREDDRQAQIATVENLLNAGVNAIVLAPLDETALTAPVAAAKKAGVPVVIMDSPLRGQPGTDFVSLVATDNFVAGRQAAARMAELLEGKGKVLVLRYQQGSASTSRREDGFLDGLKAHPGIEVISSDQYAGATTEAAYAKAENLLARFGEFDGAFTACEPVAFGMLRALRDAGRAGKTKLVGFDTSAKLIEALTAGEIHGLVLQDAMGMGERAVRAAVDHFCGRPVEPTIDTGSWVATRENMNTPEIARLLNPPYAQYLGEE